MQETCSRNSKAYRNCRKKAKLFMRPWNTAMREVCAELWFIPEAGLRKDFMNEDLVLYLAFLE